MELSVLEKLSEELLSNAELLHQKLVNVPESELTDADKKKVEETIGLTERLKKALKNKDVLELNKILELCR